MPKDGGIGASSKRREDVRFLTGRGKYTDDINLANQTYAHFLRSEMAHGTISSIDTSAAEAMPGVVRIFTSKDFEGFGHFRSVAMDMLLGTAVKTAYDLDREDRKIRDSYGDHLGGRSMLLARRLTEAGVPVVQVCCAAGDL